MFDILFGWRKASKCKKVIKRVQCRLKLLKSKRQSIVRQLREDVAQLIKIGYEDIAFNRADHLFMDQNTMAVYELLDNFCEFIIIHLSYIRRNKDCPNDINEAISSLIFASARCGDLPELRVIRKLFGERYGKRFEMTALELLPGNLVNLEVKEKLSIMSVPDDVKHRLVNEIARDYCLRPEILALEYASELQKQEKEHGGLQLLGTDFQNYGRRIEESQVEASNANDIEGKAIYVDSAPTIKSLTMPSHSHQSCDTSSTSCDSSIVRQSSSDSIESPINNKAEKADNFCGLDSSHKFEAVDLVLGTKVGRMTGSAPECKEERKMTSSSSESLPQVPDEMIVYLDDIEEVQSSLTKEGSCQDQRIFKFKSSPQPKNQIGDDNCDVKQMDLCEAWDKRSSSSSSRTRVDATRKRSRRRSASRENLSMKDTDCVVYYGKPCNPTHKHRSYLHSNPHKKNLAEKSEESCHAENSQKHPHPSNCFNLKVEDCCLNNPCYCCTVDGRDDCEVPPQMQNRGITIIHGLDKKENFHHCHLSMIGESDTETEWYTFTPRPRRSSSEFGAITYDHFTKLDCWPNKQCKIMKGKVNKFDCPGSHVAAYDSCPKATIPSTQKETKAPYLRAMTMPQERTKESQTDNVLRSMSFPIKSPNHVHPKLPDYDDIAAKFMALKKQHLQNRHH